MPPLGPEAGGSVFGGREGQMNGQRAGEYEWLSSTRRTSGIKSLGSGRKGLPAVRLALRGSGGGWRRWRRRFRGCPIATGGPCAAGLRVISTTIPRVSPGEPESEGPRAGSVPAKGREGSWGCGCGRGVLGLGALVFLWLLTDGFDLWCLEGGREIDHDLGPTGGKLFFVACIVILCRQNKAYHWLLTVLVFMETLGVQSLHSSE